MAHKGRFSLDVFQSINQRAYQEDRWVAQPFMDGYLMAVLDGHGGEAVADLASSRLAHYFRLGLDCSLPVQYAENSHVCIETHHGKHTTAIQYANESTQNWQADYPGREATVKNHDDRIHEALRATVNQLVVDFSGDIHTGSTVSMAYILPTNGVLKVYTAQLGDSAIVILTPEGELHVTNEHSVMTCGRDRDAIELHLKAIRAKNNPPFLLRGAHLEEKYLMVGPTPEDTFGIAVTRAIGDSYFDGLMIRTPELQDFSVPLDSVILGVTDGVHCDGTKEDRHAAYRAIAQETQAGERTHKIGETLAGRSDLIDNITVIFVGLTNKPQPQSSSCRGMIQTT